MNAWRVIAAALVIFAAGVVTGGLTVRLKVRDVPPPAVAIPPGGFGPMRQRGELLDRMQHQLYLTAEQRQHIEQILRGSHDRMKQLWDSIAPQAQLEHRRVHDLIQAELNPEQKEKFEALFKSRGFYRQGNDDRRRREGGDWRDQKGAQKPDSAKSAPTSKNP